MPAQLQRFEDSAPDSLEFERLKEHFEPFLRTSSFSSSSHLPTHPSHHTRTSSITAAASAALARDIPGVGRYNNIANPLGRSRGKDKSVNKDEMPEYRSRGEVADSGMGAEAEFMKHIEDVGEVAGLEQRWVGSWKSSLQTKCTLLTQHFISRLTLFGRDLRPLRVPLHSKVSKRCPSCTHILIKPEQKAQSVRYKIKLVAANYLPAITVTLPHTQDATKRIIAKSALEEDKSTSAMMYAGKTYPFHLALTNPLYDPIQVRLSVQRMHVAASSDGTVPEKTRRPPFAVSLPTTSFPVAAFAEAWEYEDDEDMFGVEDDELGLGSPRKSGKDKDGRGKTKTVGVLEKKANLTVVGGEVVIGKEARGNVKVHQS